MSVLIFGCTRTHADNYDPFANMLDASCIIPGCMSSAADNTGCSAELSPLSTTSCFNQFPTDNSICIWSGCMDPTKFNHQSFFNHDCNGDIPIAGYGDISCCVDVVDGCIDPLATNYDPLANTDNGSCCGDTAGIYPACV